MPRARTWIRRLHLATAASAGLVLVVAGLTGSALVFRDELDAWLYPELLRVQPGARAISLAQTLAAARQAYPAEQPARMELARVAPEPHVVVMTGADPLQVYVDPYRGTVLGARRESTALPHLLFEIHTTLLAGHSGELVMGFTGLLLVVSAASGLLLWWPGMRRGLRGVVEASRVRARSNWKRTNFDLHRTVGFWSVLLLGMSGFTGSALVFHDSYARLLDALTGSEPRLAAPRVAPAPAPLATLDTFVARARSATPGLQPFYLILPAQPGAPAVVRGRVPGELHPNGRNFSYFEPASAQLAAAERSRSAPLGTRLYDTFYPLHIGRWGGLPTRLLYVALGLTPLVLVVSGGLMWWNRAGRRRFRRSHERPMGGEHPAQRRPQRVA